MTEIKVEKVMDEISDNNRKCNTLTDVLEHHIRMMKTVSTIPQTRGICCGFVEDQTTLHLQKRHVFCLLKREGSNTIVAKSDDIGCRWLKQYVCADGNIRFNSCCLLMSPEIEENRKVVQEAHDESDLQIAIKNAGIASIW